MEKKEDELFRRYRETGDVKLRNEIAEKYLYIAGGKLYVWARLRPCL